MFNSNNSHGELTLDDIEKQTNLMMKQAKGSSKEQSEIQIGEKIDQQTSKMYDSDQTITEYEQSESENE